MKLSGKKAYITIPASLPPAETDLDRIEALVQAAKRAYAKAQEPQTHGPREGEGSEAADSSDAARGIVSAGNPAAGAVACGASLESAGEGSGCVSGCGSNGSDESAASAPKAPALSSLVDIRLGGAARVLLVDPGRTAEGVAAACRAAGLTSCIVHTEDMAGESQLALADETICIGTVRGKGHFEDNYRILAAAEVVRADAVLLVGSRLAEDDRFLGMAHDAGRAVWCLDERQTAAAPVFGGTTKAWASRAGDERNSVRTTAASWAVCPKCRAVLDAAHLKRNRKVCPTCGHHMRMTSAERIADVTDAGTFVEWEGPTQETDPLQFPGYLDKLEKMRKRTGLSEGVRCGKGLIAGMPVALGVMDSTFFMGSMGSVVGERITRAVERATAERLPLVLFCASGGARMQEGLVSLMQMAKISAAVERHAQAGLPYISVCTDPTTGGVTASFAMQGSVILAEPRALIGFAGRRVIQDTIRQELPESFQTAEFALEHGLIDAIVPRAQMREVLALLLAAFVAGKAGAGVAGTGFAGVRAALQAHATDARIAFGGQDLDAEDAQTARRASEQDDAEGAQGAGRALDKADAEGAAALAAKAAGAIALAPFRWAGAVLRPPFVRKRAELREQRAVEESGRRLAKLMRVRPAAQRVPGADEGGTVSPGEANNAAWASVKAARDVHRPTAATYLDAMAEGFFELHGDRAFADDAAIMGGVGWLDARPVMFIAQEKGRDLNDRIARNFGCPQPEGYRKSLRLMRLAERFGLPVVCIVDTQGAFCGAEAEERGQGNAIADNLFALAGLRTPVVSVLVGEGGSGGALALALSDRVAMQEHAVYSVLSPEGFASILWKDRSRAPEAAAAMRMNAYEILEMGVVDAVLEEPCGTAAANPKAAAATVRRYVSRQLKDLCAQPIDTLLAARYNRFRKF